MLGTIKNLKLLGIPIMDNFVAFLLIFQSVKTDKCIMLKMISNSHVCYATTNLDTCLQFVRNSPCTNLSRPELSIPIFIET